MNTDKKKLEIIALWLDDKPQRCKSKIKQLADESNIHIRNTVKEPDILPLMVQLASGAGLVDILPKLYNSIK